MRIQTNFRGNPRTHGPTEREAVLKRQACSTANRKVPITLPRLDLRKEPSK